MTLDFDTVTDWIGLPLFTIAIVLLIRTDRAALTSTRQVSSDGHRRTRAAGLLFGFAAFALTIYRFVVLADG